MNLKFKAGEAIALRANPSLMGQIVSIRNGRYVVAWSPVSRRLYKRFCSNGDLSIDVATSDFVKVTEEALRRLS